MGRIANRVIRMLVSGLVQKKKPAPQAKKANAEKRSDAASNKKRYSADELIALQKLVVVDAPNSLIMSEGQLIEMAFQNVNNDIRIIEDCKSIIIETIKPEVFFSRFQLLEDKCERLKQFEPFVPFKDTTPTDMLAEIQEKKDGITMQFIKRYYEAVKKKAEEMKTDKGKKNQFIKYYNSLEPYFGVLSEENIKLVRDALEQ